MMKALITEKILEYKEKGVDMILCTGGMSVDPDDRTPGAIKRSGAADRDIRSTGTSGCDVFTRHILRMAHRSLGLPGCVMYAKSTIFDHYAATNRSRNHGERLRICMC